MRLDALRYEAGLVRGFLHHPTRIIAGHVLTHGAGLNCESPLLVSLSDVLCQMGFLVLRCDLRFRVKRPTGPPSPATASQDRDGLREAIRHLQRLTDKPVFLGGHSYGARQSTILMTEPDPPAVLALCLLSYPLHPPRKLAQLRTAHFPQLHTPSLFLQGTRDPFASPAELAAALTHLPATTPAKLVLIEKAGHELSPRDSSVAALCAGAFAEFATPFL